MVSDMRSHVEKAAVFLGVDLGIPLCVVWPIPKTLCSGTLRCGTLRLGCLRYPIYVPLIRLGWARVSILISHELKTYNVMPANKGGQSADRSGVRGDQAPADCGGHQWLWDQHRARSQLVTASNPRHHNLTGRDISQMHLQGRVQIYKRIAADCHGHE